MSQLVKKRKLSYAHARKWLSVASPKDRIQKERIQKNRQNRIEYRIDYRRRQKGKDKKKHKNILIHK